MNLGEIEISLGEGHDSAMFFSKPMSYDLFLFSLL